MTGVETFIIRVWSPADGPPAEPALRGKVSHVRTGRDGAFVGAEELLAFLSGGRESGRPDHAARSRGD